MTESGEKKPNPSRNGTRSTGERLHGLLEACAAPNSPSSSLETCWPRRADLRVRDRWGRGAVDMWLRARSPRST